MLFHTPVFFVFVGIILILFAIFRKNDRRKLILLIGSYIFYMWWNPVFILLIIFSTVIDYFIGSRLESELRQPRRKLLLVLSIIANLGVLGVFKYFNFFAENLMFIMKLFGSEPSWTHVNIILPVGISFYTFQTMSYTIDIYKGRLKATRSPLNFALFVSFFPQLVAGPIVRASEFLPQLETKPELNLDKFTLALFLRGLFKKVVIADYVGILADSVFGNPYSYTSAVVWLATISFSIQIYCDFSGYTDMAIAVGRLLGYKFPQNFRRPYFSRTPSEFWKRWHISLSSWLRDYLYISLGGNRKGSFNTQRNLMLTMVLGGLWHGASWNFVLWGFLHGLALIVHKLWNNLASSIDVLNKFRDTRLYQVLAWALLQYFVLITWISFRIENTGAMLFCIKKFILFDFNFSLLNTGLGSMSIFSSLFVLFLFFVLHAYSWFFVGLDIKVSKFKPVSFYGILVIIGFLTLVMWPMGEKPFIYFQF